MFHGARVMIYQSLLNIMSYPSVKKRSKNHSSGDVDKSIKKIQTGKISQAEAVREYSIPRRTLGRKCNNKRENLAEKRPGYLPVLREAAKNYLVQWELVTHK